MNTVFMDPGRLRTELILQEAATTPDGMGGHTEEWREVTTLFALLEPFGAQSRFAAAQHHEIATHRVTLRFRDDVRSGMRFLRGERALEIVTVEDADETGRYLVCRVREEGR
jgi:SPP1 family predicted phage head-tail adaptor